MDLKQELVSILNDISSQNPALMKPAEARLKGYETVKLFHKNLFDVFLDRDLPANTRWLAIITFKNGIDKFWRRTHYNPMPIQEKEMIRPILFSCIDEQVPQLALQYCVAVSRVARWDFPTVWPELPGIITANIRQLIGQENGEIQHTLEQNMLYILHLFVKSLCGRTMARERQALRQLTPSVVEVISPLYMNKIEKFNAALQEGNKSESLNLLKEIRLCIKIMRRLFVLGYEKPLNADEAARGFYQVAVSHQMAFYSLYAKASQEDRESEEIFMVVKKICLLYGKMYLDFQKSHAVAFITMPGVNQILSWYWTQIQSEVPRMSINTTDIDESPSLVLEPLIIQGLLLYKNVIKNYFYMPEDDGTEDKEVTACRAIIDGELLPPAFVEVMANTLVHHYITLKSSDLQMWSDDPEQWLADESSDIWEYDVRRCAERVFMDLVNQNKEQLIPQLSQMFWVVDSANENGVVADLMMREGIYAALGLCANDLYNKFDFCKWLTEPRMLESPMGMVKWRIAWLIGRWITVQFPNERRNLAYDTLLHLSRREENLVVRMTAISSLAKCIDDWDFDETQFLQYLGVSIERATEILIDVSSADLRMQIVSFLSAVIERMQDKIAPFAEPIVNLIQPLWESAEGENLYQASILGMLTKLVESLGPQSVALHNLLIPLIRYSIDIDNPANVYLGEDGMLMLWAVIRKSPSLTDGLVDLIPYCVRQLQFSTEILKPVLKILEGYILIDGVRVFMTYGDVIIDGLKNLLSDNQLAARGVSIGLHLSNTIVQCVPYDVSKQVVFSSGLFWLCFTKIMDNEDAAFILVYHAGFISRVAVHYTQAFSEALACQTPEHTREFMKNWVDLYGNIGQVTQRRLHALALAMVVATTNQNILASLPSMVPIWAEIISDTGSSLYYEGSDDNDDEYGLEATETETERRKNLLSNDPVHTLDIKDAVKQKLLECESLNGTENFNAIMANVDSEDFVDLKNQLE